MELRDDQGQPYHADLHSDSNTYIGGDMMMRISRWFVLASLLLAVEVGPAQGQASQPQNPPDIAGE